MKKDSSSGLDLNAPTASARPAPSAMRRRGRAVADAIMKMRYRQSVSFDRGEMVFLCGCLEDSVGCRRGGFSRLRSEVRTDADFFF